MTKIRLYLDEDAMSRSLVFGLRARNVDVLTASEAAMVNRPDADHLFLSAELSNERNHAGIILASQQRYSTGEELRAFMRLIASVSPDDMRNRLEFLSAWV